MADPFVHISAVAQEVTNRTGKERFRDFVFDDQHPAVGNAVAHEYSINIPHLLAHPAQFEIKYTIRGTIEWDYTSRRLAFLSRWAHKMAFESLAWGVVVQQIPVPAGHTSDLLDARYDEVREWARRGQPSNKPRPVFRRPPMGANPTWQPGVWDVAGDLIFQVTVFGDWYAVALTTEHHDAQTLLEKWVTDKWTGHGPIWVVSDTITPWSAPAPAAP